MTSSADGAQLSPNPPQIECYPSGAFLNLYRPDPRDIHIEDIAHHTSLQTRYCGAVREFYSIAEHACLVHDLVKHWFDADDPTCLAALFHDAAEYACHDLTAPLKWTLRRMDRMSDGSPEWRSDYDKVEDHIMYLICKKYNINGSLMDHQFVRTADLWAMRIEAHQLTKSGGSNWRYPLPLPNEGLLPEDIGWVGGRPPRGAENAWLKRLWNLRPDIIESDIVAPKQG